jgi:HopA1 effector protein family
MTRFREQLLDAARIARDSGVHDPAELADVLYDRWYSPPRSGVREPLASWAVALHLRAADEAGARFVRGWTALTEDEALAALGPPLTQWQVPAARNGDARWVDPVDVLYEGGIGVRPPAGAPLAVSARRDALTDPLGWWTAFSATWTDAERPLARLYWSVPPERLFALAAALTGGLPGATPWALKCPLDLERCTRPDAVVLYFPTVEWPSVRTSCADVHRAARDLLAADVPALTLELDRGLALAEDPGDDSFGSDRCRLVAEGMSRALPDAGEAALAAAAEQALQESGIAPEAPYLGAGSRTEYAWSRS